MWKEKKVKFTKYLKQKGKKGFFILPREGRGRKRSLGGARINDKNLSNAESLQRKRRTYNQVFSCRFPSQTWLRSYSLRVALWT